MIDRSPSSRQRPPCPLLATAGLGFPEADSRAARSRAELDGHRRVAGDPAGKATASMAQGRGKRQRKGTHTGQCPSTFPSGSAPRLPGYYQGPSARPAPPSTQDLGDNLGLEAHSGEFSEHLLFQC